MSKLNNNSDFWITKEQELLLKASLFEGDKFIYAWEKWKSCVNFEQIDPGSYRLLPLLYQNLVKHKIKDPLTERLKGIYRRTWFENQILSRQAIKLLELFYSEGIKTIILKGFALIHFYYKDYGLRPMSDFDILVPTNQAVEAVNFIRKLGWTSEYKFPEKIIPIMHSCGYTNSYGLHHLDLHWHLLIESCQPDDDDDFWDGAFQTKIKNISVYVLNPADFFLHICIHGMKWSIIPPFRWVADAMFVLNLTKHEFDWNRLITQAKKRRLLFPLLNGLEYLVNNFNAPVPTEILTRIREIPISKTEQIEYKYKIENQKMKLLGNVPVLWFDSLRLFEHRSLSFKLFGFFKYLKNFWDIDKMWQLPFYTLSLGIRKILTMLNYRRQLDTNHTLEQKLSS
jgi:hypothetical protein